MASITELCGETPENYIKEDISSNPNYVFTPDPNFEPKLLYDSESNTVLVNSFVECEHYVSGGWGFEPLKNSELIMQNILTVTVVIFIFITYLTKWFFSKRKKDEF